MENRIKECQIDLFANRTSTGTMAANQRRIKFAMTSGCPYKAVFATAHRTLCGATNAT
jgi:hypothetical protein